MAYKATGRPNLYIQRIKPHLKDIEQWVNDNMTITAISKKLKISKQTFYKYLETEKDLINVVKNRDKIDEFYEDMYTKQLKGYYVEEEQRSYVYEYNEDTGKTTERLVSKIVNKKYIKGGDSMYIFSAKNKMGWTDKDNQQQSLGTEDDPITISIKNDTL